MTPDRRLGLDRQGVALALTEYGLPCALSLSRQLRLLPDSERAERFDMAEDNDGFGVVRAKQPAADIDRRLMGIAITRRNRSTR